MGIDTNFLLRTFLPGTGGRGIVRSGMETMGRSRDKRSKNPLWCVNMTRLTANSAGSAPVFVQISGFGENPLKYTDPDGNANLKALMALFLDFAFGPTASVGVPELMQRSLYSQQFGTESAREAGFSKILGIAGAVLGTEFTLVTIASDAATPEIDPTIVLYTERKAFIEGARAEICRIDELLSTLDESDTVQKYFLTEQKDLLSRELSNNRFYDQRQTEKIKSDFIQYGQGEYVDKRSSDIGRPISYNNGNTEN
jgi:hypothetical protein